MLNDYQLFGPDSAEDDTNLYRHFIETGAFRKVKNHEKLIVVGRKGSGKSAIFRHLSNDRSQHYIKLLPNKYAIDIFQKYIEEFGKSKLSSLTGFAAAWKFVILSNITKEFDGSQIPTNQDIVQKSIGVLEAWAKLNVELSRIQDFATKDFSLLDTMTIPNTDCKIDINVVRNALSKKKIHVLIDDLDNVWQSSMLGAEYIYGLISCARDLVREYNLYITIFIREDIFTIIQRKFHQIDNIRQLIESIDWNPTLLRNMIGKRIQNYFSLAGTDYLNFWTHVFPKEVNGYSSFNYMVERTQLRPRELLQFCSISWELSKTFKKTRVQPVDVIQSELTYSNWKLNDLCSEYSSRYTNIDNLFNNFSRTNVFFTKEEVLDIIQISLEKRYIGRYFSDDTSPITDVEILNFLYECGFLRARVVENGKNKFKASSSAPNLNLNQVNLFDLHPAYRRSLNG